MVATMHRDLAEVGITDGQWEEEGYGTWVDVATGEKAWFMTRDKDLHNARNRQSYKNANVRLKAGSAQFDPAMERYLIWLRRTRRIMTEATGKLSEIMLLGI